MPCILELSWLILAEYHLVVHLRKVSLHILERAQFVVWLDLLLECIVFGSNLFFCFELMSLLLQLNLLLIIQLLQKLVIRNPFRIFAASTVVLLALIS